MKTNSAQTLPCCQVDEIACRDCRYFGQPHCVNIALKDAMNRIAQLEETISLMKIQMQGDCGVCRNKNKPDVCAECRCIAYKPGWEYEGLPEVKRHDKPV